MLEMQDSGGTSRRRVLFSLGGAAAVATGLTVVPGLGARLARASETEVTEVIKEMVGEMPAEGAISIDLPEIAENGNTVPLSVEIDAPMTADSHVQDILVLADGNPSPRVAQFHFTPMNGKAAASTRMRLVQTQNVVVVARMSDGQAMMASKQVKVTIGGCGG